MRYFISESIRLFLNQGQNYKWCPKILLWCWWSDHLLFNTLYDCRVRCAIGQEQGNINAEQYPWLIALISLTVEVNPTIFWRILNFICALTMSQIFLIVRDPIQIHEPCKAFDTGEKRSISNQDNNLQMRWIIIQCLGMWKQKTRIEGKIAIVVSTLEMRLVI